MVPEYNYQVDNHISSVNLDEDITTSKLSINLLIYLNRFDMAQDIKTVRHTQLAHLALSRLYEWIAIN